jgi:hypothetical protein
MTKKTDQIFATLQEKKIKPKAKWKFLLKDYLLWGLFGLTILIGALAVSVIIFLLLDNDWQAHQYLNKSFLAYFFLSLPYIWFFILIILTGLAYFNYIHTKHGYRYNPWLIVGGSIVLSLLIGGLLFSIKLGDKIDQVLYSQLPIYKKMVVHKMDVWNQPEKGLLAGRIIKIDSKDDFIIRDFNNREWQIIGNHIEIKERVNFQVGGTIKIFGELKTSSIFQAKEIRPWRGREEKRHPNKFNNINNVEKHLNHQKNLHNQNRE